MVVFNTPLKSKLNINITVAMGKIQNKILPLTIEIIIFSDFSIIIHDNL